MIKTYESYKQFNRFRIGELRGLKVCDFKVVESLLIGN